MANSNSKIKESMSGSRCGKVAMKRVSKKTTQKIGTKEAELGLLKDIINRVANELNLPTENGNRVHDVLCWLNRPKTIEYQTLGEEFERVLYENLYEMYES